MDSENVLSETVSNLYEKVNANNSNTCEDCKWWKRNPVPPTAWGECTNEQAYLGFGDQVNHSTVQMFGCIHWQVWESLEEKDE